ncbi:hypothetical protein AERO_06675 [Aeromicrobium fastidiosum]|uniref:hypothetical protein n=1 Tax=Aeromicrobium fastidiosum TaxID=52699 RepID=UPI0020237F3A|nr:hypothetical protein [Aeromicrobium fastidiosum]MCL8251061.1 hypothetical protein [Aeromicrobium fastidiosum]
MIVHDPSGATWRVKRRWLPWRLRRRDPERLADVADAGGGSPDDLLIGLAIFVGVIVLVVVVPFIAVLAIMVAELLLLLLLLPLFVLLRAAAVARWPVEAWRADRLVLAEAVRGWRTSHRRMLELADDIRGGRLARPGESPTS